MFCKFDQRRMPGNGNWKSNVIDALRESSGNSYYVKEDAYAPAVEYKAERALLAFTTDCGYRMLKHWADKADIRTAQFLSGIPMTIDQWRDAYAATTEFVRGMSHTPWKMALSARVAESAFKASETDAIIHNEAAFACESYIVASSVQKLSTWLAERRLKSYLSQLGERANG